jgi:hypothetical protein
MTPRLFDIPVTGWGDIPSSLPCALRARDADGHVISNSLHLCLRCPGTIHLQPSEPGRDWHEAIYQCDTCGRRYMPWYPRDGYMRRKIQEMKDRGEL